MPIHLLLLSFKNKESIFTTKKNTPALIDRFFNTGTNTESKLLMFADAVKVCLHQCEENSSHLKWCKDLSVV